MSVLSIPVLLQLAAACGGPAVPDARMVATARVESGLATTAVHNNRTGESVVPPTVEAAIAKAREWLAHGDRIDAGVMQVTDRNWRWLGLDVESVFDPQRNVCAGKRVLVKAYERAASCVYNSGKPDCSNDYPRRIEVAMSQSAPVMPAPAPVQVVAVPSGRAPAWDVYASARPVPVQLSEK